MIRHRVMTQADLRLALDWAAAEGWNPGLEDAEAFLAADPDGFFVAIDNDQPVAAISVVNHSDDFAFLGLYLCHPDYRGRGIGYRLWTEAIAHAGGRTVGLDGVPAQQGNYRKSGFVLTGETTRFAGAVNGRTDADVTPADAADIPALIDLEAATSGWRKPAYLAAWFADTAHRRTFVVRRKGRLQGAVTVRKCRDGAKIGPLLAPDAQTAHALIEHAATAFGSQIILDVPSTSDGLLAICAAYGLAPGFATARMYRGTPQRSDASYYAVGTLELG